jgi:hypothetical protein
MNRLVVCLLFLATSVSALTQPQRINFQGKLINPTTNNPQTGTATLIFNLYNVPTGGSPLYTETQTVSLSNGVFTAQIGSINAISRELFVGASAFLGITVQGDPAGELAPRQGLVMSGYAYTANQLSDTTEVRLIAGPTYSTFTSAGNLIVPYGLSASTLTLTAAAGSTVTATGTSLTLLETGDTFGAVALTLENRNGANGAVFRELGSFDLIDFVFQGLVNQRNIRYENRAGSQYMADPEFQIGSAGAPTLVVSDIGAAVRTGNFGVGTVAPASLLDVGGAATVRGATTVTSTLTVQGGSAGTYSVTTASGIAMNAGQLEIGPSAARGIYDNATTLATTFSSNVVVNGNIDAADFDWIFLASGTLTTAAVSLTVPVPNANVTAANLPFPTDMRIMISVPGLLSAAGTWEVQFNGDTANDYATSVSEGLAGVTNNTSRAFLTLGTASNTDSGYCALEGSVVPSFAKSFIIRCTRTTGVVTAAPIVILASGFWSNATATINSIKLLNSGTGNFPVGTTMRVFAAQ